MFTQTTKYSELESLHKEYAGLVDGFELSLTSDERVEAYENITLPEGVYTIHSTPEQNPSLISHIVRDTDCEAVVYHPTKREVLNKNISGKLGNTVPSVENLDSRTSTGKVRKQLRQHIGEFGFTLDVQHAYEHDPTFEFGLDLLEQYGNHLTHLHVSGGSESKKHELVHKAENRGAISEFILAACRRYPNLNLVIEGEYTSVRDIEREVDWLHSIM